MANEITTAGCKIGYAVESTAGTRPTTGYINISSFVTGVSGLAADYDSYDVTPLGETERHSFVRGLQANDGKISLTCNINPTSRGIWETCVAAYAALTGGKKMWWCFQLPGDDDACYIAGEPCEMGFPDVETAQAVQGAAMIIENGYEGWNTAPTAWA